VGGTCGTHERRERCLQGFGLEDNIKLDIREIGIDEANWIQLAQDRAQWRVFVNTVMNLRVPNRKQDIFYTLSDNQLFK
jgi:hypothetical protein